ncbi:ADP-ribosylglycohydrolase family protein [Lacticaseibacillus yichunensis]|uniref:ADP-ribosylglycohydrolase family protein n=1 Tax=Lacticaseibacillus yichunensis TaxID=2486015 RepID=A0ABW4CQC8_9LACO|nr:ADP-ribosylglycohydrolase family protein [Lacticaseibacillus yichunensis]
MTAITSTRITQLLLGGMIADAYGVPYEFRPRQAMAKRRMDGYGTYDQPAGSWSDDSSLTLILAANLLENGSLNDLMDKMVTYLDGAYTPMGECFDIGNTTRKAIIAYAQGTEPRMAGDRSPAANGNGALMRIAPLAVSLLNEPDPAVRRQVITDTTIVTHGHERSVIASVIYVELLRHLLAGESLTVSLTAARDAIQNVGYSVAELSYYQWLFTPSFPLLPESDIRSSGYVVDTLEAAIWLNFQPGTYPQLVMHAVDLGEDTDTVAQIAATIYCAAHPNVEFPKAWRNDLILPHDIAVLIARFAGRFSVGK